VLKRKSEILAIAFTAVLMLIAVFSTVEAKPGADKNNPKFFDFVLHAEYASRPDDYPSEWIWNPPSVMDDMVPQYSEYLALPPDGARVLLAHA
jgi:hypothetical protein